MNVQYHFSEEVMKRGKSYFDFMGSDPDDLSLLRFKEKWGSQSLDIPTYIKDYHPMKAKLWEWGKKRLSSGWGNRVIKMILG